VTLRRSGGRGHDQPERAEHGGEPAGHGRGRGQRATHRDAATAGPVTDDQERQVRRQQREPARVDRRGVLLVAPRGSGPRGGYRQTIGLERNGGPTYVA
jgi:hypothetical protein